MFIHVKAQQAATALLYFGPVLAGLAGFGWTLLPPFVLIFTLRLMLLRPHLWPQSYRAWASSPALLDMLAQVLIQILLVALLFALGRGIGGVLGHISTFDILLPIAVSLGGFALIALAKWRGPKPSEPAAPPAVSLRKAAPPPDPRPPAHDLPEHPPLPEPGKFRNAKP